MYKKLKRMFAITDAGAAGMVKASIAVMFKYTACMFPMIVLMYFAEEFLGGGLSSAMVYVCVLALVFAAMYLFINIAYQTTYTETYKEAANLRISIAETLRNLPLSYFSRHNLSDLSQTVMQDVADLEHAMSHAIPEMFGFAGYFLLIGTMLVINQPLLGATIMLPIVLSGVCFYLSSRMQIKETSKYFHQLRDNSEAFQEAIEMHEEIRSYGQEEKVGRRMDAAMDSTEKMHIKTEAAQAIPSVMASAIVRFSLGLTVLVGAYLYSRGEVSLLYLIGYIIASARIMDGVVGVYMNIAELLYLDSRIRRIRELGDVPLQQGSDYPMENYDISLEGVGFSYNDETGVIDGISFEARQGQVTALIGPSGCGKTTILRLMSRLYDYRDGSIKIGGRDIKTVDTDSLFKNISIVFQDVSLFNTSVMENIRIGRRGASDEEVMEAARMANCHEFISNLPHGYETAVGENGMKLSGGERQRISIARALLKDAPIILLDEISASLDVENETKIQESLQRLIKGKTVVIISHRLKSVEKADKIVLIDKGRLVGEGTHEQLKNSAPLYREMLDKARMTEEYTY